MPIVILFVERENITVSGHHHWTSRTKKEQTNMNLQEIDESVRCPQAQTQNREENSFSPSAKRRRKVSFHVRVKCRQYISPSLDPEDGWYTKGEIEAFRAQYHLLKSYVASRGISLLKDDDLLEVSVFHARWSRRSNNLAYNKQGRAANNIRMVLEPRSYHVPFILRSEQY